MRDSEQISSYGAVTFGGPFGPRLSISVLTYNAMTQPIATLHWGEGVDDEPKRRLRDRLKGRKIILKEERLAEALALLIRFFSGIRVVAAFWVAPVIS
jgi:hypothetical protein